MKANTKILGRGAISPQKRVFPVCPGEAISQLLILRAGLDAWLCGDNVLRSKLQNYDLLVRLDQAIQASTVGEGRGHE